MFSFVLVLALSAVTVKMQTIGNVTNQPVSLNCNCSINSPMNTTIPTKLLNSTSMQMNDDNMNCNCTNFQGTTTLLPPAKVTQGGSSSNQPVSSGGSSSSNKAVSSGGSSSTNPPAQGGSSSTNLPAQGGSSSSNQPAQGGSSSSNQPGPSGGVSSSNQPGPGPVGGSSSTNPPAQGGSSTNPLLTLSPQVQQILKQFFPTLSSSAISTLAANQSVKKIFNFFK
jgi:hypothetical protein